MPITLNNLIPQPMMDGGWDGNYSTAYAYVGTQSLVLTGTTSTPEVAVATSASIPLVPSHIYYARVYGYQATKSAGTMGFYWPIAEPAFQEGIPLGAAGKWNLYSALNSRSSFSAGSYQFRLDFNNTNVAGTMYFDGVMLIDLTADFGSGSEPTQAWCDANIPFFAGKFLLPTKTSPLATGNVLNFAYTGTAQGVRLAPGRYKFEVWGGQGGYRSDTTYGGKGGYSSGQFTTDVDVDAFVYTGGAGNTGKTAGGFNGGGKRTTYNGGGGASDIRLLKDDFYHRVIVAGGGGSDGASNKTGGYGGGASGQAITANYGTGGYAGTQTGVSSSSWQATSPSTSLTTQAGAYAGFGFGGNGINTNSGYGGAGGGGWYGGSGSHPDRSGDDDRGGGGGSGFVWTGSNAPSGYGLTSAYYLTSASTVSGNTSFAAPGGSSETGHTGDGYVRITVLEIYVLTPPAPQNLQATDVTKTAATITWDPVDCDSYKLALNDGTPVPIIGADNTTYKLSGLTKGAKYTVTVLGVNENGDGDPASVTFSTPLVILPPVPDNISAVSIADGVEVTWSATADAVGYVLKRDGEVLSDQIGTTYIDTNPDYFKTSRYSVYAYNGDGNGDAVSTSVYLTPADPTLYLITDRTQADVDEVKNLASLSFENMTTEQRERFLLDLKGVYNASDLNRVTAAIEYLKNRLEGYGYQVNYTPITVPHRTIAKLPDGYTPLEYIQSSGTQYLDTGVVCNQNTSISLDFTPLTAVPASGNAFVFGTRSASAAGRFSLFYGSSSSGSWGYGYNTSIFTHPQAVSVGERITVSMGKGACIVNGSSSTYTVSTFSSNYSLVLFADTNTGTISSKMAMRVYSFQIKQADKLVRDFAPCINETGAVGLYDMVEKMFYGDTGGGAFYAGPKKTSLPTGYTELEYITSSGTQYIDTGVVPNGNTRAVVDVLVPTAITSSATAILGQRGSSATTSTYLLIAYQSGFRSDYNATIGTVVGTDIQQTRVVIDKNKGTTTFNGGLTQTIADAAFTGLHNLLVFATNNAGSATWESAITLYALQLYDNDILIRDYVPAQNSAGVGGLYDKANDVFYQNAGTGAFTAGPVVENNKSEDEEEERDPHVWYIDDIPTEAEMDQYLQNVAEIKSVIALASTTPQVPTDMDKLTFEEANDIERILKAIEHSIIQVVGSFRRSGQFTFWSGYLPLPCATMDTGRTWEELDAMNTTFANWRAADWYLLSYGNLEAEGEVT